jgi:hypothetical protein
MRDDFAVFILTHGRPSKVKTLGTLKRLGYTGKTYLIIDSHDKEKDKYISEFGEKVIIFDKEKIKNEFDIGDNFDSLRGVVYARNANFEIAKNLGLKYFLQLDDDYVKFDWRFNNKLNYAANVCRNLNKVFLSYINFIEKTPIKSIALTQGGDFIGGSGNQNAEKLTLTRKCMNSFFCKTENRFKFLGRINEDVITYTCPYTPHDLFFTSNHVSLTQTVTQSNSGGMTELYLDAGTYVKSFYSVIFRPSCVKVKILNGNAAKRLHHLVSWDNAVPLILNESIKKK